ncbi:MAG: hypothetical protein WBF93_06630 [Pirellulales bacterium]
MQVREEGVIADRVSYRQFGEDTFDCADDDFTPQDGQKEKPVFVTLDISSGLRAMASG